MSKKASPTLVGTFVIASTALLVAFVLILSSGSLFTKKPKFLLVFEGSVKGLSLGSPVNFRGVRIGSVTEILVRFDVPKDSITIPVIVEIDPSRLTTVGGEGRGRMKRMVERGLRGQLQVQSLVTGQLTVDLDLHPGTPQTLSGLDMGIEELPTIPSPMQDLQKKLHEIDIAGLVHKVTGILDSIDGFLTSPETEKTLLALQETMENARDLTANLDAGVPPLLSSADKVMKDADSLILGVEGRVGPIGDDVDRVADSIEGMTGTVTTFLDDLDAQVTPLAGDVRKVAASLSRLADHLDSRIEPLMADIDAVTASATGALDQAKSAFGAVEGAMGENSSTAYTLGRAIEEITRTARSIRILAESIENRPDELIRGKSARGGAP
jgi:paraquat-inducible protein B